MNPPVSPSKTQPSKRQHPHPKQSQQKIPSGWLRAKPLLKKLSSPARGKKKKAAEEAAAIVANHKAAGIPEPAPEQPASTQPEPAPEKPLLAVAPPPSGLLLAA